MGDTPGRQRLREVEDLRSSRMAACFHRWHMHEVNENGIVLEIDSGGLTEGVGRASVCSEPMFRTVVSFGAGVKDGGVLEDGRWQWRCLGCRDDVRWNCLEILLSVERERTGPEIFWDGHLIGYMPL
jgi:hypothetical protein